MVLRGETPIPNHQHAPCKRFAAQLPQYSVLMARTAAETSLRPTIGCSFLTVCSAPGERLRVSALKVTCSSATSPIQLYLYMQAAMGVAVDGGWPAFRLRA